ncbi:hypothetical protein EZS27_040518, partial [termite gut metagenome]
SGLMLIGIMVSFDVKISITSHISTEFSINVNNINDLFRLDHNFSFQQFLETYQAEAKKLFVIDSAEKLAELNNLDILQNLITRLKDAGWIIVFTTRYSYLDDLKFHIKETYQLPCEVIDIPLLNDTQLEDSASLPDAFFK